MARHSRFSFAFGCCLLSVLILCHEVLHVEARRVREVSKTHHHHHHRHRHHQETGLTVGRRFGGVGGRSKRSTGWVDHFADLRSTEPGHSPGVGHSINN
ncbi:uncharacterized protein J3R85_005359 [Psidium guajava]|nr:uncharacterized protein J3R85_005359 [Psidium guajava]